MFLPRDIGNTLELLEYIHTRLTLILIHSGIRAETVEQMVAAFNKSCLSYVPEQGTVGASGDLAPLSHLALGLIGQGSMWDAESQTYDEAAVVLAKHGLRPIELGPKEGMSSHKTYDPPS
jgi:histidine ammonia-lyase